MRARPLVRAVICMLVLAGLMLGSSGPLWGQEDSPLPDVSGDDEVGKLTVSQLKGGLKTLEGEDGIDDAAKELLRGKYQQAIDFLAEATENQAKEQTYRDAIRAGPSREEEWLANLAELPAVETLTQILVKGDAEEIQGMIDRKRAILEAIKGDYNRVSDELSWVKGRPVEISLSLPDAHRQLAELQSKLESLKTSGDQNSAEKLVDMWLLQAEAKKNSSELKMLQQEQLSQTVRESLIQAKLDRLEDELKNAGEVEAAYAVLLKKKLAEEVTQMASQAKTMIAEVSAGDAYSKQLVQESEELAKEFETLVGKLNEVTKKQNEVGERIDHLVSSYAQIKEQLKVSRGGVVMAQVLFNLERRLPSEHTLTNDLKTHKKDLDFAYLSLIALDQKLDQQAASSHGVNDKSSDLVKRLLTAKAGMLDKLKTQYGRLIRETASLVAKEQRYLDQAREVRNYLSEELFWVRSSPPLNIATLRATPAGLVWLFKAEHWQELFRVVSLEVRRQPGHAFMVLLGGFILLMRRKIFLRIKETNAKTYRIASDRFSLTMTALLWSMLLAVPIPLMLGYLGWLLGRSPDPSDWLQGFGRGMRLLVWPVYALALTAVVCHKQGLLAGHFKWPERPLIRVRRAILLYSLVYLPSFLVLSSCLYGDASSYFNSVGRLSFIVCGLWTVFVYWKFLSARKHQGEALLPGAEKVRWFHTLRVGFVLMVLGPLLLVAMAWFGFLYTALDLNQILLGTIAVSMTGVLVYWMLLRWFMIRVRRLALADALKRRRERREAAQQEPDAEAEDAHAGEVEAQKLDLTAISGQTQHLLRLVCATGTLLAVGLLWSQIFPVFTIIDTVAVVGTLSLLDLMKAVMIGVITTVLTKDLPGVIKLVSLRSAKLSIGSLNALTSLCQYVVIAIGFAMVFNLLDLGWAQFGWIATALSVGLGFGLQEVVANFVCGLILLFERPIRVGDLVTVEGVTGTVTRIQMRATTIINWDRQEFVVPNKTFVTGTLLNWTLHDSMTRLVITVGVSYSSDVDHAREILLEVAKDHPRVIEEPRAVATFEEFADSSLTLRLKVYITNVERRIEILSQLHSAIKKSFDAGGIEIAFPQRDLHIKGSPERLVVDSRNSEPDFNSSSSC